MTGFPVIRPGDVERLSRSVQDRLLRLLAEECAAAAVRHREILHARRLAAIVREPAEVTSARRDDLVPPSLAELRRRPRARLDEVQLFAVRVLERDRKRATADRRRPLAAPVQRDSLPAVAARRRDLLRGTAGPTRTRPDVVARSA